MLTRRRFNTLALAGGGLTAASSLALGAGGVKLNEDGLHVQPWFIQSFLDLRDDLQEATDNGKHFAIIWEQKGCPYCREMHRVNFAKKQIATYVPKKFAVLQLNLWGSRSVTDFDGEEMEEKALARKWRVNFTPTINFFPQHADGKKSGRDLEVMRMPGYFKPFHFLSMFEFVEQNAYKDQNFQRYLQAKFKRLEAEGKKPEIW